MSCDPTLIGFRCTGSYTQRGGAEVFTEKSRKKKLNGRVVLIQREVHTQNIYPNAVLAALEVLLPPKRLAKF